MTTPTRPTPTRPLPRRERVLPVAPRLEAKAEELRTRRRRRRLRRGAYGLLGLGAVLVVSWLGLASPLFSVRTVQVSGATLVTPDAVRAAAGVRAGTPLARVDTQGARLRVAALGPVAGVSVVRAWPHTVRVEVRERVAVATAHVADGSWVLVDGTGARYAPSAATPAGLPELQVADPTAVGPAVAVLAELPAALRAQLAAVQEPSPSSVVLLLRDGRTVVWGEPGESARKAAVVEALLPRPGRTIDVTTPSLAVVR